MKKLHIIMMTAVSLVCGVTYASSDDYHQMLREHQSNYRKMLESYNRECQVPTFGSWFVNKRQKDRCKDLIKILDNASENMEIDALNIRTLGSKNFEYPAQLYHHGPAREFWKDLK